MEVSDAENDVRERSLLLSDGRRLFLIEDLRIDAYENDILAALTYHPVAIVETRELAEALVAYAGVASGDDYPLLGKKVAKRRMTELSVVVSVGQRPTEGGSPFRTSWLKGPVV